jgi:hypothetical protein
MRPGRARNYAPAAMTMLGVTGREDGQILPGLVMLLLAILALGVVGFQVGKATIQRSQAQTAADAAALAGAREIKRQLEVQWATFGTTNIDAIDEKLVEAQMRKYAELNKGRIDPDRGPEINDADVRVWVETQGTLGEDAKDIGQEDTRGSARARAALSLGASIGGVGAVGGTGAGGSPLPTGATPKVTDEEWDDVARKIGKPPLSCPDDVITLGLFLKEQGFQVWQNAHPELGGNPGHWDKPNSWHRKCGNMGAIDVNFGACGDWCPSEMAALNPIRGPIEKLGFYVLWLNYVGHYDHMHIDPSTSAAPGGAGFAGPLEDVLLDVRLVDWDKEIPTLALLGGGYGTVSGAGNPDLQIVKLICEMSEPFGPKIRLAAFEAAIVESGIRNLNHGHANSHGVFQQQWSVGEWGNLAQTLDPVHATRMFLITARRMDEGQSAGELAADVQRPREDLRYKYGAVAGQAQALIEEHC